MRSQGMTEKEAEESEEGDVPVFHFSTGVSERWFITD